MTFHAGQILVFDRAGSYLGTLQEGTWSVSVPRSYALNDIEEFGITIPLLNKDGTDLVDAAMVALLSEDNLIYVEDEISGLPGWGGYIDLTLFGDEMVEVKFLGGLGLLTALQTDRISQSGGVASTAAQRLISAANAKKAAHGDLQIGFAIDGSSPLYGTYEFEGDIYSGLVSLANDTLCEFWPDWTLGTGGLTLSMTVRWNRRVIVDHSATVIHDGPGGALKTGSKFQSSGLEVLNRIRLKGTPTHLADFLDYDCIKSIVKDISPEVEFEVPALPGMRLREDLTLTVNFGLSDDFQKAIATVGYDDPTTGLHVDGIQSTYISYYKTFLYAYHNWQGKPFLDGYDWSGPDGSNDKGLTLLHYRTWNKLGKALGNTIVTTETDGTLPNAVIDEWELDTTIMPVGGAAVGVALDWSTQSGHWIADSSTGNLVYLDADGVTETVWGNVTGGGETLMSVATDIGSVNEVWVLVRLGGVYTVKAYDVDTNALLTSYVIPSAGLPNDIAVDFASGLLYVTGTGDANVYVYDINSGSAISPDPTFSAGGSATNIGISVSGGVAYVLQADGTVRMLFAGTGQFAGTFSSGLSNGDAIYADPTNRRIWVIKSDGSIAIYHAYIALGAISDGGSIAGAPGFDEIAGGQFVRIVLTSDRSTGPETKSTEPVHTFYNVKAGDTLWKIAKYFYGNGSLWHTIYNNPVNRAEIGSNPNHVTVGMVFVIPGPTQQVPEVTGVHYRIVYTKGRWIQEVVPGPIGQPDQLSRTWDMDEPVDATSLRSTDGSHGVAVTDPAVVIEGEEGRVCDWNPTLDGYGVLAEDATWRTASGHVINTGHGWYPHQWDVPDRAFEPPPKPYWPEGRAYAEDYLNHKNRKATVQQVVVTNQDGLWALLCRGGTYTINCTAQGPRPGGISVVVRVLRFSPNEFTGEAELVAEIHYADIPAPTWQAIVAADTVVP